MIRNSIPISFKRIVRLQSSLAAISGSSGSSTSNPDVITPNLNVQRLTTIKSKNFSNSQEMPINVKATYFPPTKNPIKYGDLIAEVQLRSYESANLDFYIDFIQRVAFYLGMPMTGPKPLPTRRERWTVIRSPFVHAKSKENFERSTHKRLLKIWDTNDEIVQLWLSYIVKYSVAGVGVKVNYFKRERISMDWENIKDNTMASGILTDGTLEEEDTDLVNNKVLEILKNKKYEHGG